MDEAVLEPDDDIIVTGKIEHLENLENLKKVLVMLCEARLRLKPQRCYFAMREVEYLGFRVSGDDISADLTKVRAMKEGWTFIYGHIKEGEFIIIAFMGKFNGWVDGIDFCHEIVKIRVGTCPDDKDIVNVPLPHVDVVWGLGLKFWFKFAHEYRMGPFCAHGGTL